MYLTPEALTREFIGQHKSARVEMKMMPTKGRIWDSDVCGGVSMKWGCLNYGAIIPPRGPEDCISHLSLQK